MAFAHVGIDKYAQSNQDLYSLEEDGWPRDVVKKAFNIMMNAKQIISHRLVKRSKRKTGFLFNDGMMDSVGHLICCSIHDAYPEWRTYSRRTRSHFMNKEGNICMAIAECVRAVARFDDS